MITYIPFKVLGDVASSSRRRQNDSNNNGFWVSRLSGPLTLTLPLNPGQTSTLPAPKVFRGRDQRHEPEARRGGPAVDGEHGRAQLERVPVLLLYARRRHAASRRETHGIREGGGEAGGVVLEMPFF